MLEFHKEVFKNKKKSSMELFHRGGWGEAKKHTFCIFKRGEGTYFLFLVGREVEGKYPYLMYFLKRIKEIVSLFKYFFLKIIQV